MADAKSKEGIPVILEFDNAKTVEKLNGSKVTYALRTEEDTPVKIRLTLEAKDPKILERIVHKSLTAPIQMILTNLELPEPEPKKQPGQEEDLQ